MRRKGKWFAQATFIMIFLALAGCEDDLPGRGATANRTATPADAESPASAELTGPQGQKPEAEPDMPAQLEQPDTGFPDSGSGAADPHEGKTGGSAFAFATENRQSAPDASELARADRIMAFANQAQLDFAQGYFHLADTLGHNAQIYKTSYTLGRRPRNPGSRGAITALTPPRGLFSAEENRELALALREMDSALQAMFQDYGRLDKYVHDDSIMDDGVLGDELTDKIAGNYARFKDARAKWLAILDVRSREAEAILLYDHPLRRQILAAQELLVRMQRLARLTRGDARREAPDSRQMLEKLLAEAERPPFAADPALERTYRAFLTTVRSYINTLDRTMGEGWHAVQQAELQNAADKSRNAYNAFVRQGNAG